MVPEELIKGYPGKGNWFYSGRNNFYDQKIYIHPVKEPGWLYRKLRAGYLIILDRLTRKQGINVIINDTEIRLPGLYSRYFPKNYEKKNFDFLRKTFKSGMTAVDIGAHLGIYSVNFAKLGASKVYCFEPTPSTFDILKRIINLNQFDDIIIASNTAIGQRSGKAIFHINDPVNKQNRISVAEANSLKYIDHGNRITKTDHMVETISVDDLSEREKLKIDFIKIDAEGSEVDILRGALRVLQSQKPAGIISMHCFTYENPEKVLREFWDIMEDCGLTILFENDPVTMDKLIRLGENDIFDLQFIGTW